MARVEVVSNEDSQDALALDPETLEGGMHYRFCRPSNIAKRKAQGYTMVLRSETGVKLLNEETSVQSVDDLVRVGNLVLMSCAEERFKQRRNKTTQLSRNRLVSAERAFEQRAKKRGVRTLTRDEGEMK